MVERYPDNLSSPDTVQLVMPVCEAPEVRPKLEECASQAPELDEPPVGNQWVRAGFCPGSLAAPDQNVGTDSQVRYP
ncbi:hypothetical protein CDEST_08445 [Colletotrichum destructivum]|uniref:Uncharacterized protein n=1 Tax=Colletotrichum destructivum TaxID=34406 RepID=A0AAX4IJW8_9PEZI|nr:hypothetical protein CDEST_08445 [Colletotrichum destructivum]